MPDTLQPPVEVTKSVGDYVTAQDWNTYVRDAVSFLARPPILRLSMITGQLIPTGGANFTRLQFDLTDEDSYNGWNSTYWYYTVPATGWYDMKLVLSISGVTSGFLHAGFVAGNATSPQPSDTAVVPCTADLLAYSDQMYWTKGQFMTAYVWQSSGASIYLNTAAICRMSARWVHS